LKKLIGIVVILALLAGAIVPATVAAWDPSAGDSTIAATTPIGDLVGKIMVITFTLLGKWVEQTPGNVTVEVYDDGVWDYADQGAFIIGPLSSDGETFIGFVGDIVMWGTAIVADMVRLMAGVTS
jgi:hypothetical protein